MCALNSWLIARDRRANYLMYKLVNTYVYLYRFYPLSKLAALFKFHLGEESGIISEVDK